MIINDDCINYMKNMENNSIDSIVTDPPYNLGFMEKNWDKTGVAFDIEVWKECLRVLKHGGFLLSFASTKNYHKMATSIEYAGFIIKDVITWNYSSGMPKGQDIAKAIDGHASTEEAQKWEGWKTQLKPAIEFICVAQKPISEKTYAENVLK